MGDWQRYQRERRRNQDWIVLESDLDFAIVEFHVPEGGSNVLAAV